MTRDEGLLIDEATIRTIAIRRTKVEGETEPRVALVFDVALDRVQVVLARLARAYRSNALVTLRLDFAEQMELSDARKTSESNGHSADTDTTKLTTVTPIGGRSKKQPTPA